MRRNDVVFRKSDDFILYGRVNRFIDSETVEWICCGKDINIDKIEDLEVIDYKGRCQSRTFYHRDKDGEIVYGLNEDGTKDYNSGKEIKLFLMRFYPMPSLRRLKQIASRYHGRNVWRVSKRPGIETD